MDLGMRDKLLQKLVDFFSEMPDQDAASGQMAEGMPGEEAGENPLEESQEKKMGLDMPGMESKMGGESDLQDALKNKMMKG
jgi:hypothetical protein